jgi:hypothetical protein
MVLSLECQQCGADLELELTDLLTDPTLMTCPNCKAKADPAVVEALASSLDEAVSLATRLSRKFTLEFTMDPDDIEVDEDEVFDDADSLWANDVEEEVEED